MWSDRLAKSREKLEQSIKDEHPRVRLESAVAASYLPGSDGVSVAIGALDQPLDVLRVGHAFIAVNFFFMRFYKFR